MIVTVTLMIGTRSIKYWKRAPACTDRHRGVVNKGKEARYSQSSTSLPQGTYCKNTNRKSKNFLMIRNCRNDAPTLVSSRKLRKDTSSLELKRNLRLCRQHVDCTHNLEISNHPELEDVFVRIRKSAQSWIILPHEGRYCLSIMIEFLFEDQTVHGFVLWIGSINRSQKCQKFPSRTFNCS